MLTLLCLLFIPFYFGTYFLEFGLVMYRLTVDVSNCVFGKLGVMLQRVARLHTVQFASEFALLTFHEFIFNL